MCALARLPGRTHTHHTHTVTRARPIPPIGTGLRIVTAGPRLRSCAPIVGTRATRRVLHRFDLMNAFISLARADWGPAFRALAGRVAYVVAVAIVAAEVTYRAGLATGRAIHWLSDRLAGLASGRIDRAAAAAAAVAWAHGVLSAPEPVPAGTADIGPSLADAAAVLTMACAAAPDAPDAGIDPPALESLTVAQLRQLARARGLSGMRRARRGDLIAALV